MSGTATLPDVAEQKTSFATSPPQSAAREDLPVFFGDEHLVLSDFDQRDAHQTQVIPMNGNSRPVPANRNRFLLPSLSRPRLPESKEYFNAIQKWEGYVTEVGEKTFCARLERIVGEGQEQEADIYIQEVDRDDRTLIQVGAVFYWSIGYLDTPSGRLRGSIIRFRRLPVWTRGELESANAEADRLKGLFDVE